MAFKIIVAKRTLRSWCMHALLFTMSTFLAVSSGYMAYELTRESSIAVGFTGIGFYVMFFFVRSLFFKRN